MLEIPFVRQMRRDQSCRAASSEEEVCLLPRVSAGWHLLWPRGKAAC